jgi:hypothetical protein
MTARVLEKRAVKNIRPFPNSIGKGRSQKRYSV